MTSIEETIMSDVDRKRTRTKNKVEKFDPYKMITDQVIEMFESEIANPGSVTFFSNEIPRNAITGRPYNGINILMVWYRMAREHFTHPLFATFNQIRALGSQFPDEPCHVKRGEKGTYICFWKRGTKKVEETNDDGETVEVERESRYMSLIVYRIFNVDQIEAGPNVRERLLKYIPFVPEDSDERNETIELFLDNLGSKVTHRGRQAAYDPKKDSIMMPTKKWYKSLDLYYHVRLHEEAHRTGHKDRLNRNLNGRFGDNSYAFEELIAELASAFVCAELGIPKPSFIEHAAFYVSTWVKGMRGDSRAIFSASSEAKKIVDWMKEQQSEDV